MMPLWFAKIWAFLMRWLGIPGLVLAGAVLFYEGVFVLNWWPVNNAPYVGWLIEGEVNRRVSLAETRAKRGMVQAAELARERAQREAAELAAQTAAKEATRAQKEQNAVAETAAVLEAHLNRLEREKKGLSHEVESLLARPVNGKCVVDQSLLERMRRF